MIFFSLAVLCLHALGVQASLTCSSDRLPAGPTDAKLDDLMKAAKGPVAELCHSRQVGTLSHVHEDIVFTIERENIQDEDDCVKSFSTIVTQCKASGSIIDNAEKGVKYTVSLSKTASKRDEAALEARKNRGPSPPKTPNRNPPRRRNPSPQKTQSQHLPRKPSLPPPRRVNLLPLPRLRSQHRTRPLPSRRPTLPRLWSQNPRVSHQHQVENRLPRRRHQH
jgi:hypothetical protein